MLSPVQSNTRDCFNLILAPATKGEIYMKKVMRHSIVFGGVLSLVLIPAFAGDEPGDAEMGGKKGHSGWFQKLDKDSDGKISQEEFQKRAEEKFNKMDSDKDGAITEEEWQEAIKHWKKKHSRHSRGYSQEENSHHDKYGM